MDIKSLENLESEKSYLLFKNSADSGRSALKLTRTPACTINRGRILVIDKESAEEDHMHETQLLEFALNHFGFRSQVAWSLQQVIATLSESKVDGLIVDVQKYSEEFDNFSEVLDAIWHECLLSGVQTRPVVPAVLYSKPSTPVSLKFQNANNHIFWLDEWKKGGDLATLCEKIYSGLLVSTQGKRLMRARSSLVNESDRSNNERSIYV